MLALIFLAIASVTIYIAIRFNYHNCQYDIQVIQSIATTDLQIKTKREAIFIAIEKGILQRPEYKGTQEAVGTDLGWSISAYKNPENWAVHLKTRGILPSYTCRMYLDSQGNLLNERCEWNK